MTAVLRRRLLAALTAALSAATVLAAPGPAAAVSEASDPGVTILSPSPDTTVGGDVPVQVRLVSPESGPLTELIVSLGRARVARALDADIAPGCDVECDLTVLVPTGGWAEPGDGDQPAYDPDGRVTLSVSVTNGFSWWQDARVVTLDNDRPVVTPLDLPPVTGAFDDVIGLSAQDSLMVRADVATTGGPEVTSVRFTVPWAVTAGRPAATDLVSGGDGRWSATLDTSGYPDGSFTGWLVALDAAGRASSAARVSFVVNRGLPLTFTPAQLVHAGVTELNVTADARGKPTTWPTSYTLRVDGEAVYTTDDRELWQHPLSWARELPPVDVANGAHQLSWHALDNRGGSSSVTRTVTVNAGPSVTVTPGSTLRGQAVDVTATLSAFTGGTVRTWRLEAISPAGRGTILTEGTCAAACPQARTVRVETSFDQIGKWRLWVVAVDSYGAVRSTTRPITVSAATSTRLTTTSSAVTYGGSVRLTGTVLREGRPLPGAPVTLQYRPSGSTIWSTRGSATTNTAGTVAWQVAVPGTGAWRAVTAARSGVWGASIGSVGVVVRSRVALLSGPPSLALGRATTWTWRAEPYEAGTRVLVQTRRPGTAWVTIAQPLVASNGTASARLTFTARGTTYLRVVRPATARAGTGEWSTTRWVG